MARGAKVFTEQDKQSIKEKLRGACKGCWLSQGYKETGISELCAKAEISTGAFYNLYSSKEDLFCETLEEVQTEVNRQFIGSISSNPTKLGFLNALNLLYGEYESKPILYDVKTPDFLSFYNKLPLEKRKQLEMDNGNFFRQAIKTSNLILKIEEQTAFSVFSILFSTISAKNQLSASCDYSAAFQFMLRELIDEIFE